MKNINRIRERREEIAVVSFYLITILSVIAVFNFVGNAYAEDGNAPYQQYYYQYQDGDQYYTRSPAAYNYYDSVQDNRQVKKKGSSAESASNDLTYQNIYDY